MSIHFEDPSPVIAWPNTRPATTATTWARWRNRLFGITTEHIGADDTWSPADDLAAGVHHTDRIRKVDPLHGLSPAGFQYATGTEEQVHAGPDDTTGIWEKPRLPIAAIAATPHHALVDEHLGPLDITPDQATPFHDAIQRWLANGGAIDDQTTTTGEKDQ